MHSRDVVGSVFRPSQVFFLSSVRLKMASNERAFKECSGVETLGSSINIRLTILILTAKWASQYYTA